jgi:hypothetical protein
MFVARPYLWRNNLNKPLAFILAKLIFLPGEAYPCDFQSVYPSLVRSSLFQTTTSRAPETFRFREL